MQAVLRTKKDQIQIMRYLTVNRLHEVVGGRLRLATLPPRDGELARVGRIVTDSREIKAGDVFWGLNGARFQGADFAEEAYTRGASGVVVDRYVQPRPGCWSLEVADAQQALVNFAVWNRARFMGRVVGVTGSVGKTTTRQMIAAVLGRRLAGVASPKNYNNHFGAPLSMLAMEPSHDFVVLELAASGAGEIAQLSALCQPEIGVITRIGEAHLGGFGSRQAIADAKTELLAALPSDGHAVLTGDDPWLRRLASRSKAHVTWVGRSLDCDLAATNIRSRAGQLSFVADGHAYRVPVWGRHHLHSALAAVAVGRLFGLAPTDIAAGLANFEPAPMRCEIVPCGDATIINDSYNASPSAMRAALELLRDFDTSGRRIFVCGDMRELGDASPQWHEKLGQEVVTLCGADRLVACGEMAAHVVAGACGAGMPFRNVVACESASEALPTLRRWLRPGDVALVKGSRAMRMEQLIEAMCDDHAETKHEETSLAPSMV